MQRIDNLFDLTKTCASSLFEGADYGYEVLPRIKTYILTLGATLSSEEFINPRPTVWIARDATVAPTAFIGENVIIDHGAEIRHCAFIRGNAIVGKHAVIGNSTELKNVVIFDGAQCPHYNYVGDSILGYKAHMGAGAVTSNVKGDKKPVVLRCGDEITETGMKKVGAMLGDHAEIGCGSVLNPGTVIGRNTQVYPLTSVRGEIGANSIVKDMQRIVEKR
ncbi:MAG: UDP-N-acetylglucosamine pyrophosphorylase [Clostridia bacterium]|nr:UDP-N-acetylglucosamine pyrophosphorylase [Clostridia bacterium]